MSEVGAKRSSRYLLLGAQILSQLLSGRRLWWFNVWVAPIPLPLLFFLLGFFSLAGQLNVIITGHPLFGIPRSRRPASLPFPRGR